MYIMSAAASVTRHLIVIFLQCQDGQDAVCFMASAACCVSLPLYNAQVLKLLELMEMQMITDVQRKIQKDITLALAERARDENAPLPTDLWKHVVGRILYTVKKTCLTAHTASL